MLKPVPELSLPIGTASENAIIEGENSLVLTYLLGLHKSYDFMLWDPPYNTGNKFIFNDKFTKKEWLSFMEVRLELAKKLLKDTGVIAVHISYHELFRLGLLMDEVFGEDNRLGIINWECAYSPKNDNKGIPSTTDYILIYARSKGLAFRGLMPRTAAMNDRYKSIDGDRDWASDNLTVPRSSAADNYGIENPFTGELHFPPGGRSWGMAKSKVQENLSHWGVKYVFDIAGNCVVKKGEDRREVKSKFKKGPWPRIFFLGKSGEGRPRLKRYFDELKNEGRVLGTYWEADEILDEHVPFNLSLTHELSGHNDGAKKLIKAVLGDDCPFDTPKPLKLTERLIQMFCPKDGIVLDAFGGSATTAHAVLSLNYKDEDSYRKFIIIERGSKDNGFANTITAERVRRVIKGNWVKPQKETKPLPGSFVYSRLT